MQWGQSGLAQTNYTFRQISKKEGLSQSTVFCITQDAEGFMWFGTKDGLNKYDGYSFSTYRHNPLDSNSVISSDVRVLYYESSTHQLWAGTVYGLSKFDKATDSFISFTHAPQDTNSLSDNNIMFIYKDSKERLWVGTRNGLNLYQPHTQSFQRIYHQPNTPNSLSSNLIQCMMEDAQGQIWVGTAKGLNRLVDETEGHYGWEKIAVPVQSSDPELSIQAMVEDEKGNFWLGTLKNGLNYWDRTSNQVQHYQSEHAPPFQITNNNVRTLTFDQDGHLWVGTFIGLNRFLSHEQGFQLFTHDASLPSSLSNNSVKSIYIDKKGSLWCGTYYGGINFLDENNQRFTNFKTFNTPYSLSHNVISSFAEDEKENIWIGTEGGGLNYLDRKTKRFYSYGQDTNESSNFKTGNIKILLLDGEQLWIGSYHQGLTRFDTRSKQTTNYKHDPTDSTSLTNNNAYGLLREGDFLWVATFGGGLEILNLKNGQFTHYNKQTKQGSSLSSNLLKTIYQASDSSIWIGTDRGLNLVTNRKSPTQLGFETFIPSAIINCIFECSEQKLWIGTQNNGLYCLDADQKSFTQYNTTEGLPSATVVGILEDEKGNLWLSTNNGLSQFNKAKKSFMNYNSSHGLENLEFNFNAYAKTSRGEMLFGGINGFTLFNPNLIRENQYIPPIVLTQLQVFNTPIEIGGSDGLLQRPLNNTETVTLQYNQAIFSISFAALDYFNPDNNRYRFILEGLETEWNTTTGESSAKYTIQSPGTYTFRVSGANNDGFWNPEERQLKIVILPPPWRTWWAYLLYLIFGVSLIYGLYRFLRLRHNLQLQRLEKEQQEGLHQMKMQFFTNVTHEFRTPLTLILGPLTDLIKNRQGNGIEQRQILSVRNNAQRLLNLVNQLLTFRKLEEGHDELEAAKGNIVRFLREIFISFQENARLRGIHYEFQSQKENIQAYYDRDKMEKVLYNLLSNAFKFTPDEGKIQLRIEEHPNGLKFIVTDNGKGIPIELQDRIFERFFEDQSVAESRSEGTGIGLAISKHIIELHGGQIKVESLQNTGTSFTIDFPLGRLHLKDNQIIKDFKDSESLSLYISQKQAASSLAQTQTSPLLAPSNSTAIPDLPAVGNAALLIVEDNEEVRKYISSIFSTDYQVREAANGEEGLQLAKKHLPDLIISDIMMPVMDGVSMCSQLKTQIETSHIPVILLTARTALIFKIEGLETGADDYITKPFDALELRLRVRNLILARHNLRNKFARLHNFEPKEITLTSIDEQFLEKAIQIIENNIENHQFNMEQLTYELAVSRALLFSKFKALTNETPNNFIKDVRLKRAAHLLLQRKKTVSEVAFKVGFRDPRYFSKCFQKRFGMTPSQYMAQQSVSSPEAKNG